VAESHPYPPSPQGWSSVCTRRGESVEQGTASGAGGSRFYHGGQICALRGGCGRRGRAPSSSRARPRRRRRRGELEEERVEVGDGAGDAERAGVGVPVLLGGAAEQRREGRPAEELGAHGVALHGPALLADADRHVALRHARAAVLGRLRGAGVGHAGEPPEEALHAAFE
jgi:hypothetical protein